MLVLRNTYYSAIDENGEERLFSVSEIMTEEEYLQREFGAKEIYKKAKEKFVNAGKKIKGIVKGEKHSIKLSRKEIDDLVDEIKKAANDTIENVKEAPAQKEAMKEGIVEGEKAGVKPGFLKKAGKAIKEVPGKYFKGIENVGENLAKKDSKIINTVGKYLKKHNKITGTGLAVAGTGAIGSGIGTAAEIALQRARRRRSEKYDNNWKKQRDLFRVGDEEMSKKDFVNKWYKKDKKNK